MKQKTAKNHATRLHSMIVRDRGVCEARHWPGECKGKLETAHIISRRYSVTRTKLDNAFCMCSSHHMRFTEWPVEFSEFVTETIGAEKYQELSDTAQNGYKIDWIAELERLEEIGAPLGLYVR